MKKLLLMLTLFGGYFGLSFKFASCMVYQMEEPSVISFRPRQYYKSLCMSVLNKSIEKNLAWIEFYVQSSFAMTDEENPIEVVSAIKSIVEKFIQLFGECVSHDMILRTVASKITENEFNIEVLGAISEKYSCMPIHIPLIWMWYLRGDPEIIQKIESFGIDLEKIKQLNIGTEGECLDLYHVLAFAYASIHTVDSINKTGMTWMFGDFLR
ncbi:MAG: hypothetical protein WCS92_02800 [Candidatus Babeliales bacterium]